MVRTFLETVRGVFPQIKPNGAMGWSGGGFNSGTAWCHVLITDLWNLRVHNTGLCCLLYSMCKPGFCKNILHRGHC